MIVTNPAHQFDAVVGTAREIDHRDIGFGAVDRGLRGLHRCSFASEHELALPGEQLFQTFPYERVVIDDQDPRWIGHGWLFPTYFASRGCNNGYRATGWQIEHAPCIASIPTIPGGHTFNLASAQEWSNPHFPQCSHGDTFQAP